MTRLFIRFYVGVLIVLFLAWYIHGWVSRERGAADRARVVTNAHAGGARLVADELNAGSTPKERRAILKEVRKRFLYNVSMEAIDSLPSNVAGALTKSDIAYDRDTVVVALSDGESIARLGPFLDLERESIEASLAGWMKLSKERLESVETHHRQQVLAEMQQIFPIQVQIVAPSEVPNEAQERMIQSETSIAFYGSGERWYSGIELDSTNHILRFGPFPSFENNEQKTATTTLALVLLPAAIAIALLLRPVALQLRRVENAAEAIAGGDLAARVDEKRMKSAKPLAQSFNHMASRTESLVRTQRELLQAVSHELRTPLARMRFAIDLIADAESDEERAKRLESLDQSTEELNGLVGELLSYVRMETAELTLDPELIALGDALQIILPKIASLYPDVSINERIGQADDACVWADRRGFHRALGNLVSNAGRHAKGKVEVRAKSVNGAMIIDVDDDGTGIAAEDRQRVFEPFVRLNQTTGHGVGLGLSLVHRIVHQNGGTVEVLDSPLGGCRVRTSWVHRPSDA